MLGLIFWLSVLAIGIVLFIVRFFRRGFTKSEITTQILFPIAIIIAFVGVIGIGVSVRVPAREESWKDLEQRQAQIKRDIVWAENAKTISVQERQEVVEEIKKFNSDVKWVKANYDDLWYGYYIPDKYAEMEEVEIPQRLLIENEQSSE